jgi:hypothetical protein
MGAPLLLDARRVLFAGLIDYAGLFPPASLDMEAAVAEYRAARSGPHAWIVARFICTASRLEELTGVLTATMTAGEPSWPVSVVLDGDLAHAASLAQSFDAHMGNAAEVVFTEARLRLDPATSEVGPVVAEAATAATSISPTVTAFLEIPRTEAWETQISATATAIATTATGLGRPIGAKFRCGGTEACAFPATRQIARFLTSCRTAGIPYKATAGLHHPFRRHDAGLDVMMHGFVNVLAAAALNDAGSEEDLLVEILEDTDPHAFTLGRAGLEWRSRRIPVTTIKSVREGQFPSYGSCSFDEPVTDLITLGMLEA